MRKIAKLLLAGAGALTLGGVAMAAADNHHVLNVNLPDGSVAHIHYVGKVAPKVVVAPNVAVAPVADIMPVAMADPFVMMDRISYAMDRQMDAMLQQASAMARAVPANGQLSQAALKRLPAGTVSYSFTSYSSGNGAACSQSVQVTSLGTNQPPKVERQSQGDCSAVNRKPTPAVQQAAPQAPRPTPASLQKPAEEPKPTKGPII